MPHYGTRASSSEPLTDVEWRDICAYVDEEVRRIKPRNVAAYRATVVARRIDEVLDDRQMAKAFQAIIVANAVEKIEDAIAEECAIDTATAMAAMRRGLLDGKRERAELLSKMESELAKDPSWF